MELSEKIGLAFVALGLVIDAFEMFFPGALSKMKRPRKMAVFLVGTLIIVIGLVIIFFWPNQKKEQPDALFQAGGNASVSDSVFDFKGKAGPIASAGGSLDAARNQIHEFAPDFPPPDGKFKTLSNSSLRAALVALARKIIAYDKSGNNSGEDQNLYYRAHFADDALSLSSEAISRIGLPPSNMPSAFVSGEAVVKSKIAVGYYPMKTTPYFLEVVSSNLPPDASTR